MSYEEYYDDDVYGYCKKTGEDEDITQERCSDCTYSSCEFYPSTIKKKYEGLDKLRSNEMSKSVLESACKLFSLTEEEAEEHLTSLFTSLQSVIDVQVKAMVKDAVAIRTVRYLDKKMGAMLDKIFEEAVSEQIIMVQKDDKAILKTVQVKAHEQIKDYFNSGTKDRYNKDTVQDAMEKVIGEKVSAAIEEIKTETIDKFSKDAMKKMMGGMCKAIQNDKRLLTMMTDMA